MCGLVAMSTVRVFTTAEVEFYKTLLYLSGLRGKDSTGHVALRTKQSKKKLRVLYTETKSASSVSEFMDDFDLQGNASTDDYLYLGHCRAATRGIINDENCQPFVFDSTIGMHNGTITCAVTQGRSDSFELIKSINEKKDPKEMIEMIGYGAAALIWYDTKEHILHAYRNEQRTLALGISEDKKTIALASEADMMKYAYSRAVGKEMEVFDIEPHHHLQWRFDFRTGEAFPRPEIKKHEKYSWSTGTTTYRSDGHGGWVRGTQRRSYGNGGMGSNGAHDGVIGEYMDEWDPPLPWSTEGYDKRPNGSGVPIIHKQADINLSDDHTSIVIGGSWIKQSEAKKMLASPCSCCDKKVDFDELTTDMCNQMVFWEVGTTGDHDFICAECMANPYEAMSNHHKI